MQKKQLHIFNFFNVIMSLLAFIIFNPNYKIWGTVHSELSTPDAFETITITENTVYNILNNSYYTSSYKNFCIIIVILEIVSITLCIFSLIFNYVAKQKVRTNFIFSTISFILLATLSILLFVIFFNETPFNIYSLIFLSIVLLGGLSTIIYHIKTLKRTIWKRTF